MCVPVILDLDGDGISVTELSQSTHFVDGGDGLEHRTAWAGVGDGVLFYDVPTSGNPNGDGEITEQREYVFTEWDPTAGSDLDALRSVFDTDGDGKLTNSDTTWNNFKVMVTEPDGTTVARTLDFYGITEIDLTGSAANIELPDGSVITGTTTFKRVINGQEYEYTVGEMTLATDGRGYRLEEVETTDAGGNTVRDLTGYDVTGAVAWTIHVVAAPDGSNTVNSYDDNGDGVVDRVQVITVATVAGDEVRTASNYTGSDAATGVLENQTVTTIALDTPSTGDRTETIERDSVGGGWFDQVEVREIDSDGSMVITITDLSEDGSTIREVVETVSSDGLNRTETYDLDGDGDTDLILEHVITVNANGSREEEVTTKNGDGTVRNVVTHVYDTDERIDRIERDLDGDGTADRVEDYSFTQNADGSSTSTLTVENQNGGTISSVTETLSDDALTSTQVIDADGDGDTDVTIVEDVTITAAEVHITEVTATNADGSIRSMSKTRLDADRIGQKTWVDLNQDGTLTGSELVHEVELDAVTGERIETFYDRNADGSINSTTTSVTATDGLSTTASIDLDGDGQADTKIVETDTVNTAGSAVTTVVTLNQDDTTRSSVKSVTTSDGLQRTVLTDFDGDGSDDLRNVDKLTLNADGSTTRTMTAYNGDGTVKLSRTKIDESADRLVTTVRTDADGDGDWDAITTTTEAADGSVTSVANVYTPEGTLSSTSTTSVSADGLHVETDVDVDGDGVTDQSTDSLTVLNADGSTVTTGRVENGDTSLSSQTVQTVSGDGLSITSEVDADGDGTFEREVKTEITYVANGNVKTVESTRAADNTLLARMRIDVSDDGLTTTTMVDRDGDTTYDFTTTAETTLNSDGSTETLTETRDAGDNLRSSSTVTVSGNGRSVTTLTDVNGDTHDDIVSTVVEADDGTLTSTESHFDTLGNLESRTQTVVSADGLTATDSIDWDGDGTFERRTESVVTLAADGSVTETVTSSAADGSIHGQTVTTTSDDGLTTTTATDLDYDGTNDWVTVETMSYLADGSQSTTTETTSADNTTIYESVVTVSADGRTVTESVNIDGQGGDDRVTTTVLEEGGTTRRTTELYSTGGTLAAVFVTATSMDGLTTTYSVDRDANGIADLVTTDITEIDADGTVRRQIDHRTGQYIDLAHELYETSDDGLSVSSWLDYDGDDVWDATTTDVTTFNDDGSVSRAQISTDGFGYATGSILTEVSGNGLDMTVTSDFTGEGTADRIYTYDEEGDGSSVTTVQYLNAQNETEMSSTTTISSDGRLIETDLDLDGDGILDQEIDTVLDLSGNATTTMTDWSETGEAEAIVTTTQSDNGHDLTAEFDIDADGTADIIREVDVSYGIDGSQISVLTESYASGELGYQAVTTTAANGLESTTTHDVDGDGVVDATTLDRTLLNADGSTRQTSTTTYADGELREKQVTDTSADGRLSTTSWDYDGNGVWDKRFQTEVDDQGQTIVTETVFSETGEIANRFVTTTSADGLVTTITRNGVTQTVTNSPIDNGSYTWDNGLGHQIGHRVDANGIETWGPLFEGEFTAAAVKLDAQAKQRVISEASDLYDTILDRDMDFEEVERLYLRIENGSLEKKLLAQLLVGSEEFTVRFENFTDAEFVTQLYLNAVGRAPSMDELADALGQDFSEIAVRAEFAVKLAESAEHQAIGNGHRLTNNFDVTMNPAEFERSLDEAEARETVEALVDTIYDRPATEQELAELPQHLLQGLLMPEDIAAALIAEQGDIIGVSTASLNGLSGADLVNQAYVNALGRYPTAEELQTWTDLLASGDISDAQFVASLAMSVEHMDAGDGHVANDLQTVHTINGGSGAETLSGGAGQDSVSGGGGNDLVETNANSDWIAGGAGDDSLSGGDGNDIYVWTQGDGDDVISDGGFSGGIPVVFAGASLLETDTLVLTDVDSTDVTLSRFGSMLLIDLPDGSTIQVANQFYSAAQGNGIERIEFSDGVVWDADDIQENVIGGTSGSNAADDNLYGGNGNESLAGLAGDDNLTGGLGADYLNGGNGNDTYYWSTGHGNDTIYDFGQSLEDADHLVLEDVAPDDVSLTRVGSNMFITVISTGEVIQVTNQYFSAGDSTGGDPVHHGYGIETLTFSDGTSWDLYQIYNNVIFEGDSGINALYGTNRTGDKLFGYQGDDSIYGFDGDDTLVGGFGDDYLNGEDGNDKYSWNSAHGSDTIYDTGQSLTEVDHLDLVNVASDEVALEVVGNDLVISAGGETIVIQNQFYTPIYGYGIEKISFSDGVTWNLDEILANTILDGTNSNDTLDGDYWIDNNIYGYEGDDSITGAGGFGASSTSDDVLVGGLGDDTLKGETGNDLYIWSEGDGSDLIYDNGTNLTEVDVLKITDLGSNEFTLSRDGNDLLVTEIATGEVIRIQNRFINDNNGYGIEIIEFADGVVVEVLNSDVAQITSTGTAGADDLDGWDFADRLEGQGGVDTLDGKGGNDTLIGGGGNDLLRGGDGSDRYEWQTGHGHDTINDTGDALAEIDELALLDATSDMVMLERNGNHLDVKINDGTSVHVITVTNQFMHEAGLPVSYDPLGDGIEQITFADGEVWDLAEIESQTETNGDAGANALTGTYSAGDNLNGLGGNDTLTSYHGDDVLTGGLGTDSLVGGEGSDQYVWSSGDGYDTISDTGSGADDIDTLILSDVNSTDVELTLSYLDELIITINGETITVIDQFSATSPSRGIESIAFADGVIWTADDIAANTVLEGDGTDELLRGSTGAGDNILGLGGNDSLYGYGGEDTLTGGLGDDSLRGAEGADTYIWASGDGDDTIHDTETDETELDRLVFTDINSGDVKLVRNGLNIDIQILDQNGAVVNTIQVTNNLHSPGNGYGIEVIEFANGEIWDLDQIFANTVHEGDATSETLIGTNRAGDNIFGFGGDDSLRGNDGNDILHGGAGADTLNGGDGLDIASYRDSSQRVELDLNNSGAQAGRNGGEDVGDVFISIEGLEGSAQSDTLIGDDNSNVLIGNAGHDILTGNAGFDQIFGGNGNDVIDGGDDADELHGDIGNDSLNGGTGDDTITGGTGSDTLEGGDGNDTLDGGTGDDSMQGGDGDDIYVVDSLGDVLDETGGGGVDTALSSVTCELNQQNGAIENLTLTGTADIDGKGNSQANVIIGNDGANLITGLGADDTLTGGGGVDTFMFRSGDGTDIITDFEDGTDLIRLHATGQTFANLTITQVGDDTHIDYGSGDTVILSQTVATDIAEDDFIFTG